MPPCQSMILKSLRDSSFGLADSAWQDQTRSAVECDINRPLCPIPLEPNRCALFITSRPFASPTAGWRARCWMCAPSWLAAGMRCRCSVINRRIFRGNGWSRRRQACPAWSSFPNDPSRGCSALHQLKCRCWPGPMFCICMRHGKCKIFASHPPPAGCGCPMYCRCMECWMIGRCPSER